MKIVVLKVMVGVGVDIMVDKLQKHLDMVQILVVVVVLHVFLVILNALHIMDISLLISI